VYVSRESSRDLLSDSNMYGTGIFHIDLFVKLAIQVGAPNVESSDIPILKCGKHKHEAHCLKAHNW